MIRSALLGLTLVLVATPAMAEDARLASRLYRTDEVVRIEGRAGVQATIAFGDDEHIENVAIGDSNAWQVTPNKRANVLFVKPLRDRSHTNLTVLTDQHSYFFDLVSSASARPLYVLRFRYPEKPKAAPVQQAAAALSSEEARLAEGEKPVDPATLNFAWAPKGKRNLFPARIYDDGQATYVSWAAGAPLPAILVRNAKGDEGPVNFAVRGDVIVIDGVPGLLVLRAGKDSAIIENRGRPRPQPVADALAVAAPPQGQ